MSFDHPEATMGLEIADSLQTADAMLAPDDRVWLTRYGLDPSSLQAADQIEELNTLLRLGSERLSSSPAASHNDAIVQARTDFFSRLGFDATALTALQAVSPSLVPLDNFVGGQRVFEEFGIDGRRIITAVPALAGRYPQSLRLSLQYYTDKGLGNPKLIESSPWVLRYSDQTVNNRLEHLATHGLDVPQVLAGFLSVISLPEAAIDDRIRNLQNHGLDAVHVVNSNPKALLYSVETITGKLDALGALGLDAAKIINSTPDLLEVAVDTFHSKARNISAQGLDATRTLAANPKLFQAAERTINTKLRLLGHLASALKWEGSVSELIEIAPRLLAFNAQKLVIMGRIAAQYGSPDDRRLAATKVRLLTNVPLEKYILTINDDSNPQPTDDQVGLLALRRLAVKNRSNASERRDGARAAAPRLGKIGTSYLSYAGVN